MKKHQTEFKLEVAKSFLAGAAMLRAGGEEPEVGETFPITLGAAPFGQGMGDKLRRVVQADRLRSTSHLDQFLEPPDDPRSRQTGIDFNAYLSRFSRSVPVCGAIGSEKTVLRRAARSIRPPALLVRQRAEDRPGVEHSHLQLEPW